MRRPASRRERGAGARHGTCGAGWPVAASLALALAWGFLDLASAAGALQNRPTLRAENAAVVSIEPRTTLPRCFGAVSRDPLHPCVDAKLRTLVIPTPGEALLSTDAPCQPLVGEPGLCSFGLPLASRSRRVALVGDSHAAHWRAALAVVARGLDWSIESLTRSSCPFTLAIPMASEPVSRQCVEWNQMVEQWFAAHPEVETMVTSDHPGPVRGLPGQDKMAAWVAGITAAWAALPATVRHIIVIRDDPFVRVSTLPCVEAAIERHADAGAVCTEPRAVALHRDPDVVAATLLDSSRIQVVDLTHFFCDSRLCYPVVGGALVYRDDYAHLTSVFSSSLGPFLLRRIEALMDPC